MDADATQDRGLGRNDPLLEAGNPIEFRPPIMDILQTEVEKVKVQDRDKDLKLVKWWVKEEKEPSGLEKNF